MKKNLLRNVKIALIAFLVLAARMSFGQVIFTSTADSIAVVNELYNYQVVTTYSPNAPTYSLQTAPAGMAINSSSGLVSWTPASMSAGGQVIIKAHNNAGDYYQTYFIYITDAVVCDTNIISYWPLDGKIGTSVPEVIHGYDGLWEGDPGPVPVINNDGMVGNSVQFDPNNNLDWGFNVTDENQYEFKGTCEFSVAFWFKNKPNQIPPTQHSEIFIGRWAGDAYNNSNWYIQWNNANEHVEFYMMDHSTVDTVLIHPTTITVDDENWHHVVATFWAPSNLANYSYMNLYVDGVAAQAAYDFWTDDFDGTEDLYLGYSYAGLAPYSGLLDEVTIWKKELLQSEVNVMRSRGLSHQPACQEGNTAPVITSTAITAASEDVAYSYTLTYREIDGDAITRSAPVLPAWLNFNSSTGVLSGTPANANVGDHNVTLRVFDGTVNVDQVFVITVANVNDIPVISSTAGTSVDEDVAYTYTIVASDVDPGATLTYSAPTLPSWMDFDAATHILSGTPTNDQVGMDASKDYAVVLRVTDNASASVDQSFTVTVHQVNDAPVINSQNAIATDEDTEVTILTSMLNVTDVDDVYPDAFTFTVKDGSNYTRTGNAVMPAENWNGSLTVPVDLSDGTATVSYNLTVTVNAVNDAPVFTSTPVETAMDATLYQYWITASDIENQTLTITCTTKPDWMDFSANGAAGILQGSPEATDVGTASVMLSVSDGLLSAVQTFSVVVASNPDAIEPNTAAFARVYPMPASAYVIFEFASRLGDATLEIYTSTGQLIQRLDISGLDSYVFDVTGLRPNNYIYRISTPEGPQTGPLVVK